MASPSPYRGQEGIMDKLVLLTRVYIPEIEMGGYIYESVLPEKGTGEEDRVYGIMLDETAFPKNFVATKVWHCERNYFVVAPTEEEG